MDFAGGLIIVLIFVILFSFCSWQCVRKRKEGIVFSRPAVMVVAGPQGPVQQSYAYPTNVPYPTQGNAIHPVPSSGQSRYPYEGFVPPTATPYPLGHPAMPRPETAGTQSPGFITNPPYPTNLPTAGPQPPSYSEAMAKTHELYAKQPEYNPNFR